MYHFCIFIQKTFQYCLISSKYRVNTVPTNWISLMEFCRGSQCDTFTYFPPSSKNQYRHYHVFFHVSWIYVLHVGSVKITHKHSHEQIIYTYALVSPAVWLTEQRASITEWITEERVKLHSNFTYCLSNFPFHTIAQNSLEDKWVSKPFSLEDRWEVASLSYSNIFISFDNSVITGWFISILPL